MGAACFVKMTLAKCQKLSCWRASIGKKGWPCRRFSEAKARDLQGSELRPRIPPRGSTSDILFSLLTLSFLTLQSQAALPMLDECGFVHGFEWNPKVELWSVSLNLVEQLVMRTYWRWGTLYSIQYSLLINHHESAAWSKMGACVEDFCDSRKDWIFVFPFLWKFWKPDKKSGWISLDKGERTSMNFEKHAHSLDFFGEDNRTILFWAFVYFVVFMNLVETYYFLKDFKIYDAVGKIYRGTCLLQPKT